MPVKTNETFVIDFYWKTLTENAKRCKVGCSSPGFAGLAWVFGGRGGGECVEWVGIKITSGWGSGSQSNFLYVPWLGGRKSQNKLLEKCTSIDIRSKFGFNAFLRRILILLRCMAHLEHLLAHTKSIERREINRLLMSGADIKQGSVSWN